MNKNLPVAALGHFVMKVNDIDTTYQFYTKLGLRPIGIYPDLAIIELRGGTHILIFSRNEELPFSINSSQIGQRGSFFDERFDLMLTQARSDLEVYRTTSHGKWIVVERFPRISFFGHYTSSWLSRRQRHTLYTSHRRRFPV